MPVSFLFFWKKSDTFVHHYFSLDCDGEVFNSVGRPLMATPFVREYDLNTCCIYIPTRLYLTKRQSLDWPSGQQVATSRP